MTWQVCLTFLFLLLWNSFLWLQDKESDETDNVQAHRRQKWYVWWTLTHSISSEQQHNKKHTTATKRQQHPYILWSQTQKAILSTIYIRTLFKNEISYWITSIVIQSEQELGWKTACLQNYARCQMTWYLSWHLLNLQSFSMSLKLFGKFDQNGRTKLSVHRRLSDQSV